MSVWWVNFRSLHYQWHIFLGGLIRLMFICYGIYHDANFAVSYTDVDYKVFTDASRHVLKGGSPYDRHTYRYSPLIATILIPNLIVHTCFGKVLFSLFDLLVGLLIRLIVYHNIREFECFKVKIGDFKRIDHKIELEKPSIKHLRGRNRKYKHEKYARKLLIKQKDDCEFQADLAMIFWLYNPLTIAIATRGNSDSIAGLLVLLTLYFLQCKSYCFIAGLIHGVSVHLRLYPIVYSLAMFMFLSRYSNYSNSRSKTNATSGKKSKKDLKNTENKLIKHEDALQTFQQLSKERKTIFKLEYVMYIIPNNANQLKLISGCLLSLTTLTYLFYFLYGYTFLYETYIYHLVRKDTRHNFSLFFYLQYLTADVKNIGLWQKVLISMPQIVLLLVFSVRYGLNKLSLNFSILTLTITMVTYNTVLTSQYFVWILVILPLCIWQIRMATKTSIVLFVIWVAAQLAWLIPAYFLEFRGQNTFLYIWIQSVSFFCANIAILGRLVMNFMAPFKKMKLQ